MQLLLIKKGYGRLLRVRGRYASTGFRFSTKFDVLKFVIGVDGRTICKKLKSSPGSKHIPIIMFSAHPGAQKNMEEFGADDFIPKPFEGQKILERIEVQLSKQKQTM